MLFRSIGIEVRFLVLSQKTLIFASIPIDVFLLCFLFPPRLLLRFLFYLYLYLYAFFFNFLFFICIFIVSSKVVIFISKSFDFYLQTLWTEVCFLALSQKALVFASIPIDVVLMCFVFPPRLLLCFLFLPLFAFVCVFLVSFSLHVHCFFQSCHFILESFDSYLQTSWTQVRFLAFSVNA